MTALTVIEPQMMQRDSGSDYRIAPLWNSTETASTFPVLRWGQPDSGL